VFWIVKDTCGNTRTLKKKTRKETLCKVMAAPKLLSVVRNDFKEIYSVSADHIIKIYQGLYKIRKNME
jgi:hypothetical protein